MKPQFLYDQISKSRWGVCGSSRTLRGGADIACFSELLQRLEQMRNVTRTSEVWPLIVRAYIGNGAPWKIFMLSTAELSFLGSQLSSITSGFSHLKWGNKSAFVSDFSETAGTKAWEKVWCKERYIVWEQSKKLCLASFMGQIINFMKKNLEHLR